MDLRDPFFVVGMLWKDVHSGLLLVSNDTGLASD